MNVAAAVALATSDVLDIRMNVGQLEGEALDAALAEADGFVDFAFSPTILEKAAKLQISASGGVGFEYNQVKQDSLGGKSIIDVANDAGVWLTNGAGSLTESTADAALLLLLSAARNFPEAHNLVADGKWEELGIGGVQYLAEKSVEPAGKTLGIIGMGRIGQALARKCVGAFDMVRVLIFACAPIRKRIAQLFASLRLLLPGITPGNRPWRSMSTHPGLTSSVQHVARRSSTLTRVAKPPPILIFHLAGRACPSRQCSGSPTLSQCMPISRRLMAAITVRRAA
jgi:hypothetical protein